MRSFRLKTYFTRSFHHSVSILTNILAFFLQHLLKIHIIPNPVKHKQTKHDNKFIVISRRTFSEAGACPAVLNRVMFPQILYDIVLYTPLFLPVKFFLEYYFYKLCFQLPQNVTWTDEELA